MAVSGAPVQFAEHAEVMMDFAIAMLDSLATYNQVRYCYSVVLQYTDCATQTQYPCGHEHW